MSYEKIYYQHYRLGVTNMHRPCTETMWNRKGGKSQAELAVLRFGGIAAVISQGRIITVLYMENKKTTHTILRAISIMTVSKLYH